MTHDPPPANGGGVYSTDELHSVLDDVECRQVLGFFRDRAQRVATLDELATALSPPNGGSDRAKLLLHHAALPKLADMGVIDYDPRTNVTRYCGNPRLEALLPRASEA